MSDARQPVVFLEVDQPRCALVYGETPCSAALGLTGDHKCYNTRITCQDPVSYAPTDLVTLRFAFEQEGVQKYNPLPIPLLALTTTAGKLNLAGLDSSASAFGERE